MVAQRVFLAPILDLAIRDARKRKVYHFQGKKVFFFYYHPSLNPSIMWEKYAVHKVWREIQFAFCMKIYDLELPTYFITIIEGSTVTHFHIIMGLICTV